MLRYGFTVKKCKSDGLPRSSNKRKTVRSPSWNKGFQWEARKTVDLSKKLLISLCEIFFSHIFRAFWNLWNVLRKCLDIELLYRYRSLTFSNGLLTKGRPLEARHETKDFNGKPGRPWIWGKKLSISLCEIFFSHIFRPLWNLWNVLRKCLDIDLLYRYLSLMVFHGLLTKGRPLEARNETKDFNGKPGRPWIWAKNIQFHFARYFSPIFSRFLKAIKYFAKMIRYWFTIEISKSDGLPRSPNKRKTVRSPSWNKRFQWEARKTVDLSKQHSISLCEIFFTHIFRAFWNLWNILRKCLDIDLLYRYLSLMVFHGLLTKGRPLEARNETKDFNGKPGRPWIWAKNIQFHFARYFSPIFFELSETYSIFCENA